MLYKLQLPIYFFLLFFSFSNPVQSQVLVLDGDTFLYGEQRFDFKSMRSFFEGNDMYLDLYETALRKQKSAAKAFRVSGVTFLVGGLAFLGAANSNNLGGAIHLALGGLSLATVSLVALVTGAAIHSSYRTKALHLTDLYNLDHGNMPKQPNDSSYLQLGVTPNGIGLVYSF